MLQIKQGLLLLFFLISNLTFSQLEPFVLQVGVTHETCSGNGGLNFAVTDVTAGSSMVYTVYQLPNLASPIAVTSSTSLTGLVAGNYRVIATQTLGAESNTQQRDVIILNQIAPFLYNLVSQREVCGNDGVITVNVTQGVAVGYEIIAGPMTLPLQTTNVFSGLVAGMYQVRVFNTCGDGIVRDVVVESSTPDLDFVDLALGDKFCTEIVLNVQISNGSLIPGNNNVIAYPLQILATVHPPSGGPSIPVNLTMNNGNTQIQGFAMVLPLFVNQSYTYDLSITDACGNVYQQNNNVIYEPIGLTISEQMTTDCVKVLSVVPSNLPMNNFTVNFLSAPAGFNPIDYNPLHPGAFGEDASYYNTSQPYPDGTYVIQITDGCGNSVTKTYTTQELPLNFTVTEPVEGCSKKLVVKVTDPVSFTVEFLTAPAGFNPTTFNSNHPGPFSSEAVYFNATIPLPQGTYTIKVTDECGRTKTSTFNVTGVPQPLSINVMPGCAIGSGSVELQMAFDFQSVTILSAPAALGQTLPFDVSENIKSDAEFFSMNSLPAGVYIFRSVDVCGRSRIDAVTIPSYQVTANTVTVTDNCSSFNIYLNHASNANMSSYWLQKYDATNGTWGHPQNGFSDGFPANPANAIALNNNSNNFSLSYYGNFRVVHTFNVYPNGGSAALGRCEEVLQEFEYTIGPKIRNIFSYSCSDNSFDVIVDAVGFIPLEYRITEKDGQPFTVNNGNSALFSGLGQGVYNFQIEDACGNILNRVYDISSPVSFTIQPIDLCDGQPGSLYVPYFSFFSYEWWKDNNTTTILSTANTLDFTPFNAAIHFGVYHVRITNPSDPNSCMNLVLDFEISADLANPQAGTGSSTLFCGPQSNINLFDYLSGTYSANGIWDELSDSGMLINHIWNAASVPPGVYSFKYTVSGLCDFNAEAIVTFTLGQIPLSPEASATPIVCEGETLELFATDVPGATYQWSGPNGFASTEQNPVIPNATTVNQGTYSVMAIQGGCESVLDTIDITVGTLPYFSTTNLCEGSQTILSAEMLNPAIDLNTVTYTWTYPDGTTVSTNPINVTGGQTGTYILTITTAEGCSYTNPVEVLCTSCGIPRGVSANEDGSNDEFDLSCLQGITNVKIFNRYGVNVYELDNYVNEWKGQDFKGRLLPPATYYYVIRFETGETKTGWVYLNY
ncbi:gliding motility-associated C-terminal domain-containing protein [Flavobacterium sp.]|uniref:gliding motility-associated C-terminal domain-containing protein n=1 Tax=Flavobacterium sp. TaxID=239 RepID=UPI0028BE6157|nr:gliding motility-associated C-terminal domain-containing protein [Flavobacterium sp.]